jgi:hypothetical protein
VVVVRFSYDQSYFFDKSYATRCRFLLRNSRSKFWVLNEFVSQESRSRFEIVEDSLSILLFVVVESWVHIFGSISQHTVEDTGELVGECGIGFCRSKPALGSSVVASQS